MIWFRVSTIALFATPGTSFLDGTDVSGYLKRHPVWIREGLTWEKDPGADQSWAAARILFFRQDGRLGIFDGIVFKRGGRLALGEGEGQLDSTGIWKIKDGVLLVEYHLALADKIVRLKGETPLKVPGPVQNGLIRVEIRPQPGSKPSSNLSFEGKAFEIATGLATSEISAHFGNLLSDVSLGSSMPSKVDLVVGRQ